MLRIALLEDDSSQAELVSHWLRTAGMECVHYATGTAFRAGILRDDPGLILIDWILPDDDGLAVLKWLRSTPQVVAPIMFVTSRAEEASLVQALEHGADDYLVKPLRQGETLARINALLRRSRARPAGAVVLGEVQIDVNGRRAQVGPTAVDLTERETLLAAYLLRNHGRLLTRQQMLEEVWQGSVDPGSRTVDTHISRLRSKLRLTPENGFSLITVYHKGYRLEYQAKTGSADGPV
jgi:DNA-binding response OmpR family regulator